MPENQCSGNGVRFNYQCDSDRSKRKSRKDSYFIAQKEMQSGDLDKEEKIKL